MVKLEAFSPTQAGFDAYRDALLHSGGSLSESAAHKVRTHFKVEKSSVDALREELVGASTEANERIASEQSVQAQRAHAGTPIGLPRVTGVGSLGFQTEQAASPVDDLNERLSALEGMGGTRGDFTRAAISLITRFDAPVEQRLDALETAAKSRSSYMTRGDFANAAIGIITKAGEPLEQRLDALETAAKSRSSYMTRGDFANAAIRIISKAGEPLEQRLDSLERAAKSRFSYMTRGDFTNAAIGIITKAGEPLEQRLDALERAAKSGFSYMTRGDFTNAAIRIITNADEPLTERIAALDRASRSPFSYMTKGAYAGARKALALDGI